MTAGAAATPDQTTVALCLVGVELYTCDATPGIDVDDAVFKP